MTLLPPCLSRLLPGLLLPAALVAAQPARIEFTVAALKMMPAAGDSSANFARFEQFARQAAAGGADLLVTPECYLDGYMGSPKFRPGMTRERMMQAHTEPIDGPTLRRVGALARELKLHILFGFSERRGDGLFNTMALFRPDGALAGRARDLLEAMICLPSSRSQKPGVSGLRVVSFGTVLAR